VGDLLSVSTAIDTKASYTSIALSICDIAIAIRALQYPRYVLYVVSTDSAIHKTKDMNLTPPI